jgi:hypothetical protein
VYVSQFDTSYLNNLITSNQVEISLPAKEVVTSATNTDSPMEDCGWKYTKCVVCDKEADHTAPEERELKVRIQAREK